MTNPNGTERRKQLELNPEDRDRMVRIELHCEGTSVLVKDHEDRMRKVETRQTGITVSQSGLWGLVLIGMSWMGLR